MKTKILLFIISILKLSSSSFTTGNFIFDSLLEQENLIDAESEIRRTLEKYFLYEPISKEENFSQIISEILSASLSSFKSIIPENSTDEEVKVILQKEIQKIIVTKKNLFTSGDYIFSDDIDFKRNYKKILYHNFVYQLKQIPENDSNYAQLVNQISFSDQTITDALEKNAKIVHVENTNETFLERKDQLINFKNSELETALPLFLQLAEFRKNNLDGISNFLDTWVMKILDKEAILDEETDKKIFEMLKVFPIHLQNLETSRLSFVDNFARKTLLKNIKRFGEGFNNFYLKLWGSIFTMYATDKAYTSLLEGINLWVKFFFPKKYVCVDCQRANFIRKIFLLEIFAIDLTREQNAKERLIIYIMDALRIISQSSEDSKGIKEESLARNVKQIFLKFHYFLNFNPKNVWVIDKLDILFRKNELRNKNIAIDIIPFYKNLYSVIIAMSQDYKEVGKIDFEDNVEVEDRKNPLIFDFNDYLDYTRLFMNQLEDFPMEIENYYTVFKIYNLFMNYRTFYTQKKGMEILAVNADVIEEHGTSFIKGDDKLLKFVYAWRLQNGTPTEMKMGDFSNKVFTVDYLKHYHQNYQDFRLI